MSNLNIFANEIQTGNMLNLSDAMVANPDNTLPEMIATSLIGEEYAEVTAKNQDGDRVEVELAYYSLVFKMSFDDRDEIDILDESDED